MHQPLSEKEEQLAKEIVDAAFVIHKKLGVGLFERVYERCFCRELEMRGIRIDRQVYLPIVYEGVTFPEGYRMDVLVDDLVVCELKTVTAILPVHASQVLTYLRLSGKRLGFLVNFHCGLFREGIRRYRI
jgi:GxxExxY protein